MSATIEERADPADPLAVELDRLAGLDLAGLRRRWARVTGRSAPPRLAPALMRRVLAQRFQVAALGDLPRDTARRLERLARGEGDAIPLPPLRGTRPGTLLVREWQGELHRVMVLDEGFAWNGRTFASLSEVAVAITGTKWSGPRFFKLAGGGQDRRTREAKSLETRVDTPGAQP